MESSLIWTMGVSVFINIAVLKWKIEHDRGADAALDAGVLVLLGWLFSNTISGLAIASIASMAFSMYLLVSPPKLDMFDE